MLRHRILTNRQRGWKRPSCSVGLQGSPEDPADRFSGDMRRWLKRQSWSTCRQPCGLPWIAIMEKEHDSWHGWHPWNPTWDFTDVLSCGHGQAETRTRVVKRVLFRTGHVKQIPMGFLGQTGLMQPMRITWHVNQVHLKHASRNTQASTAAGVLQNILIQRLGGGKVFFRSSFRQPTTTNFRWPRIPTPVLKAQGTSASPHGGCCHWVAHLTMGSMDWFQSLEPNEPQICSHWDDPQEDWRFRAPRRPRSKSTLASRDPDKPSSWSENCSKKSSGNSSKRDYIIILNVLNHHQHYHQKITPCLDHPEKKKHPRLNEICSSQIMSHFRRSVVPLGGLVFLVSSLEDQIWWWVR